MGNIAGRVLRRLMALPAVGFAKAVGGLPWPLARAVGRACGLAAYYLVPRIRKVGLANLDLAYGDALDRREKVRILKEAAANLGIVAAEFTRIPRIPELVRSGHVALRGIERLEPSKGTLLVSLHLGNWEWMAPLVRAYGFDTREIVRPLDDAFLNRFIDTTRRSGRIGTIPKEGAGNEMLRSLREGRIVGVLADQSPRTSAVPVTFFGQPCWATVAPVMAALRARVPVHTAALWREPDGRYTMEIFPAIPMARTGDLHDDLLQNSQRVQDELERIVRQHPEQWLWLHRRWKPRPRLQAEWDAKLRRPRNPEGPEPQDPGPEQRP